MRVYVLRVFQYGIPVGFGTTSFTLTKCATCTLVWSPRRIWYPRRFWYGFVVDHFSRVFHMRVYVLRVLQYGIPVGFGITSLFTNKIF